MEPNPNPKCPLLSLPGELRNLIYALVVVQSEPLDDAEATLAQIALLRTCHQVRHECSDIFWQLNTFTFRIHAFIPIVLETAKVIIPRIRHLELHTGMLYRGPYFLNQYSDHLEETAVCLDVSKGLRELKYWFRRSDHGWGGAGYGVRRHPVDGFEVRCPVCLALERVDRYLERCIEAAAKDNVRDAAGEKRYLTPEIFEGMVRILVPVLK